MTPTQTLEKAEALKSSETARSFDVTASVYMLRYDLALEDRIRPETYQQAYDEELTYIAEGIDRHSHTKFDLRNDEELGLVLFQVGEWRPYKGMLMTGLEVARKEALEDPRKGFLAGWAERDMAVGYELDKLETGEVLTWNSPFPDLERQLHGDEFMIECGLQPKRRMGFLYRAERNPDGTVTLESHSVDNCNPDAFAAVEQLLEQEPDASMEKQLQAYDDAMFISTGRFHRAGRDENPEDHINAYEFVKQNKQLIEYYFDEIEALARSGLIGDRLRERKEKLTYGVWARIKELLDQQQPVRGVHIAEPGVCRPVVDRAQIAQEISGAYHRASMRNEVMSGCGGSLSGKSFEEMSADEVFASIFGQESSGQSNSMSDQYGSRIFKCPKGHSNTRPHNKLIEHCKTCKISVRC